MLATSSEPFVDFYNSKTINTFSIQQIEDFLPELYFVNETKYFASKFGTEESKDVEFFFGLNWSENELFKNALDICFSVFGESNVPLVSLTCFNSDNSHLKLPALTNGLILLYPASYTNIYIYIFFFNLRFSYLGNYIANFFLRLKDAAYVYENSRISTRFGVRDPLDLLPLLVT